ncbi:MAG: hypothetical protein IPO04_10985 [Cytophagaceae bacterium]|nr:hypothetical protein [Cytophagaceae bacterium]
MKNLLYFLFAAFAFSGLSCAKTFTDNSAIVEGKTFCDFALSGYNHKRHQFKKPLKLNLKK